MYDGSILHQQWQIRLKYATMRQICFLVEAKNGSPHALAPLDHYILTLCQAELAQRAQQQPTIGDMLAPYDSNLTRTTKE